MCISIGFWGWWARFVGLFWVGGLGVFRGEWLRCFLLWGWGGISGVCLRFSCGFVFCFSGFRLDSAGWPPPF